MIAIDAWGLSKGGIDLRKLLLSPWCWVGTFLAVGWAPLFIADFVRGARPDLDGAYLPQAFAIAWMPVTALFSILAFVVTLSQVIRLAVKSRSSDEWRKKR
jgi:hypothetical protein